MEWLGGAPALLPVLLPVVLVQFPGAASKSHLEEEFTCEHTYPGTDTISQSASDAAVGVRASFRVQCSCL